MSSSSEEDFSHLKPGALVEVTNAHRVPTEKTTLYARIWKTRTWPYNHPQDMEIPKGQICLVLEPIDKWDYFDVCTVHVLIENPEMGYIHLRTNIDARQTKKFTRK